MEVRFDNLNTPAFIDETIDVRFEICNDEEEEAEASLNVKISGYSENQGICASALPSVETRLSFQNLPSHGYLLVTKYYLLLPLPTSLDEYLLQLGCPHDLRSKPTPSQLIRFLRSLCIIASSQTPKHQSQSPSL